MVRFFLLIFFQFSRLNQIFNFFTHPKIHKLVLEKNIYIYIYIYINNTLKGVGKVRSFPTPFILIVLIYYNYNYIIL
jgi:hypothetical protein